MGWKPYRSRTKETGVQEAYEGGRVTARYVEIMKQNTRKHKLPLGTDDITLDVGTKAEL